MAIAVQEWVGPEGPVGKHVEELNARCLAAYGVNPALVEEHANAERIQADGGYGRRQLWELIQNGADEMIEAPGRVEVVLTDDCLYCANQGNAITPEGAGAILSAYRSSKRGPEIGRFGLGFKSVLGVTTTPEFFSRSGSFGFDDAFAATRIKDVVGDVARTPVLRLARPIDVTGPAAEDPVLAELTAWATSVVRLPLERGKGAWLPADLANFPAQFVVFSPHISELILDDRARGKRREISLESGADGFEHRLVEGDQSDVWRVFSDDFAPSPEASRDGGAMADREVIRLQWAVPLRARSRTGALWAYFPTLEETTLSGVVNAPWKLNDDRTRVIEGTFNREILDHAADLVLRHLEELTVEDDPGNILDVLPARGREDRNWADRHLTERLNADAAHHPTLPDQDGVLQPPAGLTLHPPGLSKDALRRWAAVPNRPVDWTHASIDDTQTRRSRAERFIEASPGGRVATVPRWLEALMPSVEPGGPPPLQASGYAILVAAEVAKSPEFAQRARAAAVVVDEDGQMATAVDVLLPGDQPVTTLGIRLVHPSLAKTARTRAALVTLGVAPVDAELELRSLLGGRKPRDIHQDWDGLWKLAGRVVPHAAEAALHDAGFNADNLRVRVVGGRYLPLVTTLLPGSIAGPGTSPDVVVDVEHHRSELPLLRQLGAVAAPSAGGARAAEPAMVEFRRRTVDAHVAKLRPAILDPDKVVVEPSTVAGPLSPLEALEGEDKARFTLALLEAQVSFPRTDVSYPGNRYPATTVLHPVLEVVKRHGSAETSAGLVTADAWVGPALKQWAAVLPVAAMPALAAEALKLPQSLEELSEAQWQKAFEGLMKTRDLTLAKRFSLAVARAGGPPPATVLAEVSGAIATVPRDELRVTSSARTVAVLRQTDIPLLVLDEETDVDLLVGVWAVRRGDDEVASEVVAVETGPRAALGDLFPALRLFLTGRARDVEVARCSEIRIESFGAGGRESEATAIHLEGQILYVDERLDDAALLRRGGQKLGLALDAAAVDRIIENKLDAEIRDRQARVRDAPTDAAKLSVVVSEDRLRAGLPAALLDGVQELRGPLTHEDLAELAFAVYGVETLKTFQDDLDEAGLQPPRTWAGSRSALEFVRRLKFGMEHAGFPQSRRDSMLEVDGPPELEELHDYQKVVVREVRALLRTDPASASARGMVSLPTGAGKTRVVTQALVQALVAGDLQSPVLWIAPRDELCEQAVQAFSEVWRDQGTRGRLTLSRLWAANEAEPVAEGAQIVIATVDKLTSGVVRSERYAWLRQACCIVIDEAHFAISPSYTTVLEWQGMARGKGRVPLIGMTATPYRGMSETETLRLASRFGSRRLDDAAFGDEDPYAALQRKGVLSRVEHKVLAGADITLSAKEFEELERTRLLPSSAGDRLAADLDRNRMLLESISAHPEDWTSLVFCASLEHASVMAGLLTAQGIRAASVSGTTPPAARRHYVSEFREGRLRVLTNYAVFQEGFDAPKVRAVYVARPTYSPNVYQQMIGRGLRGPHNGGSEECLIVNVADNIVNYGEALAFRRFEHLWDGPEA
ncbi:MAG TPA: DEAD/DEAH box helicase family protein [Baekduia sp.]|uniref:DEAD/DEAH box helicase family protein n=1 Tax=Baekduia sp. TaxID=2600305 RepID=UPI002B597C27|nr:DEAD/DEAH box helicase family protein [Baekduia sp.]HMJ34967.1 DEAD/DEAH box helicase family protein [Baekduia sp.]